MPDYSDLFNQSAGNLATVDSTHWSLRTSNDWVTDGAGTVAPPQGQYCIDVYKTDVTADHYAEIDIDWTTIPPGSYREVDVCARFASSTTGVTCYQASMENNGTVELFRIESLSSFPTIGSASIGAAADGTLKITAAGTTIKVFWNGTEIISVTDANYSGHFTGIASYQDNPVQGRVLAFRTGTGTGPTLSTDLVIGDGTHATTSDNAALTQVHALTVGDGTHATGSDNLTLAQGLSLVIADGVHAVASDNLGLTQTHVLVVASGTHAQTADNMVLGTAVSFGYPASVSGRKLLDQDGNVILINTWAAWFMGQNGSNAEITEALEDIAALGFNAITLSPCGGWYDNFGGTGWDRYHNKAGQPFFTGDPLASSLGAAWGSIDHVMAEATRLGLFVIFSFYTGYNDEQGIGDDLIAAGTTNAYNYGLAVAGRYASYDNIVWHAGFDNNPSDVHAVIDALFHGVLDGEGGTARLQVAEPSEDHTSFDQGLMDGQSFTYLGVDVNSVYKYGTNCVEQFDAVWNESGAESYPVWDCEPRYDGSGGRETGAQDLRERIYATFIRGGCGVNYGVDDFWPFNLEALGSGGDGVWRDALSRDASVTAGWASQRMREFCQDDTWGQRVLVTTGLGSGDTKAAAGGSDTRALAYFPNSRTIAIDTTVISGTAPVRLRWYDPTDDSYTSITDSEAQQTGRSVTHPGTNAGGAADWLLVVDQPPLDSIEDGTHGVTSDNIVLVQQHTLVIASGTHATASDNVALAQTHVLTVADGTHAQTADGLVLVQQHTLVIADGTHGTNSDDVSLAGTHVLSIADGTHAQTADGLTLTQLHVLAVGDGTHATASDNVALAPEGTLGIPDSTVGVTSDNVVLVQTHTLVIQDAAHATGSDNVTLSGQTSTLVIGDGTHATDSDNLTLSEGAGTTLVIDDCTHAQVADPLLLVQLHVLVIASAVHILTSTNVTLSTPDTSAQPFSGAVTIHDGVAGHVTVVDL